MHVKYPGKFINSAQKQYKLPDYKIKNTINFILIENNFSRVTADIVLN